MSRISAVIPLAIACTAVASCTTENAAAPTGATNERRQTRAANSAPPSELLYVKGRSLRAYDLESDRHRKLTRLPSADVAVSPDGHRYAVVEETSPAGSTAEGFRRPVLRLGSIGDRATRKLGPGQGPLWSPDGRYVAAIARAKGVLSCAGRPGDPRRKTTCRETDVVVAYSVAGDDEPQIALGADRWSLIGWTAQNRILASSLIFQNVVVGRPGASLDDLTRLALEPAEVWGVSPSEYKLLLVRGDRTFFASPGDSERVAVDLDGALLGDGAWSPDGKKVAAVAIDQRGDRAPRSQVAVVDVATGDVRHAPRSNKAQSAAVWSQPSDHFAFVRVDPERASRLQAVLCSSDLDCKPLFSWTRGVALLALR
jgi:dipeptidyl aminopeptidase/acylaminoacyl peptidase